MPSKVKLLDYVSDMDYDTVYYASVDTFGYKSNPSFKVALSKAAKSTGLTVSFKDIDSDKDVIGLVKYSLGK